MKYERIYAGGVRRWHGLAEVRERFLELAGHEASWESYSISGTRQAVTYESLDELLVSRVLPEAAKCSLFVRAKNGSLHIVGVSFDDPTAVTHVEIDGMTEAQGESLSVFVGNALAIGPLRAPPRTNEGSTSSPSAFVGYSFDGPGRTVAAMLTEFLENLGFEVVTGDAFEGRSVSEKVKELIRPQSIVLCVFTKPAGDGKPFSDWVRDEATFAAALDKRLFVLVERGISQIPDIHGDLEYIGFESGDLAPVFLKVLQGLKVAGFRMSSGR